MSYTAGFASNAYELLAAINTYLATTDWTTVRTKYIGDRLTSVTYLGIGDGNDKIYIQFVVKDNQNILLDGMAGFDTYLEDFEQPGSIQQHLQCESGVYVDQPQFTCLDDEMFYYWLFVDNYRVILVTRMSIQYESAYLGLISPIASERQYPYPMYICGNTSCKGKVWPNNPSGSFVYPYENSGWLRREDGVWRSFNASPVSYEPDPYSTGCVFPYTSHNKDLIPNYKGKSDSSVVQDNFLLLPVILQTTNPINMCGVLRDVFWVSGTRDLSAEQNFACEGSTYICFDTKMARDSNSYFCIKM